MKIRIVAVNLGVSGNNDIVIDLPKGQKCYSLYVFKTSALAKTSVGLSEVDPGDCILISPGIPHYIRAKQGDC